MILGYKKQFPWNKLTEFDRKIISGQKKHTIRVDQHDRWRAGRQINHCHGVRTKHFDNFYNNDCTGTQKIEIKWSNLYKDAPRAAVYIDDKCIGTYTNMYPSGLLKVLAYNDGFDSVQDFFKWFNKDFEGKIIHWTDLRY